MVRLMGIILPEQKRIDYALTLIFGISWSKSKEILAHTGINAERKVTDVSEEEMRKITALLEKTYKVEGDLREQLTEDLKQLREIGSYRGMRHMRGLPARGQRTRSNSRTKKGKKKTVGAFTKEHWAKMEQQQKASKK